MHQGRYPDTPVGMMDRVVEDVIVNFRDVGQLYGMDLKKVV